VWHVGLEFFLLTNFNQFPTLKLELLYVSLKTKEIFYIICPIKSLIVRVLYMRLSKAHTYHYCMALGFKLDMLNYSTLGFRVCLFDQFPLLFSLDCQHWFRKGHHWFHYFYAPFTTITIKFCCLHSCYLKGWGIIVNNKLQQVSF
jgi:cell shape-determining protein MreD